MKPIKLHYFMFLMKYWKQFREYLNRKIIRYHLKQLAKHNPEIIDFLEDIVNLDNVRGDKNEH